jgi:hypothetical protein
MGGGQKKTLTMSTREKTPLEGSMSSTTTGWGSGDPGMGMTGVHLRVLGGQPVWPLAFHELVAASNRRAYVEQQKVGADFVPGPLGPQGAGAALLDRILQGEVINLATREVPPGEADCVLVVLGLLHVRVRCVIPEELGGLFQARGESP